MADSVQLTVELMDRVSGPARKAAAGIDKINKATNRIGKDGRLRDARGRFVAMGQAANGAIGPMNRLRSAVGRIAPKIKLIGLAAVAAMALAARAILKAAATAEQFTFTLKSFLKKGTDVGAEMRSLMKISNKLGMSFDKTAGTFQTFISAGLEIPAAKQMVKFRADLEALAGKSPAKIAQVASAFEALEKAIVTGKFEADGFMSILKGIPGANRMAVIQRVAKLSGLSIKELKKDLSKLPIDHTIKAFKQLFLEGSNAQKLGAVATRKQMETFSGAFAAFKNRANNSLLKLGMGIGPSLRKSLSPALEAMSSALGKVDMAQIIRRIKRAIDQAAPALKAFAAGMGKGLAKGANILSKIADGFGKMLGSMDVSTMETIGEALVTVGTAIAILAAGAIGAGVIIAAGFAKVLVVIRAVVGAIGSVINWFKLLFTSPAAAMTALGAFFASIGASIMAAGASLGAAAVGLGKQIIAGIPAGIKAGASAVVSSIVSVAKSAVSAAKKALGISSPSKVFASIGKMSALGYAEGMQSVNAVPSLQGSAQLAPGLGGGGATVNQTNVFETSVNEAASAAATASEIKKQQLLQMAAAFERAALELGVGTA